jgi:hypothetical protein
MILIELILKNQPNPSMSIVSINCPNPMESSSNSNLLLNILLQLKNCLYSPTFPLKTHHTTNLFSVIPHNSFTIFHPPQHSSDNSKSKTPKASYKQIASLAISCRCHFKEISLSENVFFFGAMDCGCR